jgi:manganese/zinc/iron transport system substrate-binding protein
MVADLVLNVGGDAIALTTLMGPGVDPHTYKASPGDVRRLEEARLVVANGHHLEGKLGQVLVNLGRRKPVVMVAETLPTQRLIESDGAIDPHVWFDVALWTGTIDAVMRALTEVRPEMASEFRRRAREYRDRLIALDREVKAEFARIPAERRILITAHDAFRYMGRAYGIEVIGVQGISTESEAGLRRMNELVDLIVRRRISSVFVETSVSPKNVQALIEGARARGHQVNLGGQLFSDALGDRGTPEGTYVGMVRANVRTVVGGLR